MDQSSRPLELAKAVILNAKMMKSYTRFAPPIRDAPRGGTLMFSIHIDLADLMGFEILK